MLTISVLGASGFIGSRIIECFHLEQFATLRAVVRTFGSLAGSARLGIDWRIADACDEAALTGSFRGCDAVISSIAGPPSAIISSAEIVYRAAEKAGVRRLIYLSSAVVHGQAPAAGTDESTPLNSEQPFEYNSAKVRAEQLLFNLRAKGALELVILRPGIVFGPRSRWIMEMTEALLGGKAYLLGEGNGICNSIYVDNLVEAIRLALITPAADGHAFLVGDAETVTWAHFYETLAAGLGMTSSAIRRNIPACVPARVGPLRAFRHSSTGQRILPLLPARLKRALKAAAAEWSRPLPIEPGAAPTVASPSLSLEMTLLQQCRYKLPMEKAARILGYAPVTRFQEGCRRSIGWLKFAGYPVPAAPPSC